MFWILKVTRVEEGFAVLEGDAGEFVIRRDHLPHDLRQGDTVKLEHAVKKGRARLDCKVLEPS